MQLAWIYSIIDNRSSNLLFGAVDCVESVSETTTFCGYIGYCRESPPLTNRFCGVGRFRRLRVRLCLEPLTCVQSSTPQRRYFHSRVRSVFSSSELLVLDIGTLSGQLH